MVFLERKNLGLSGINDLNSQAARSYLGRGINAAMQRASQSEMKHLGDK